MGKNAQHVRIVMDDREPCPVFEKWFEENPAVRWSRERLKTGDFLIEDHTLVERKTMSDFARSLVQGRLFDQARRLSKSGYFSCIILEEGDDSRRICVDSKSIRGAIIALNLKFNLQVLRVKNQEETVQTLIYLGRQVFRRVNNLQAYGNYRPQSKKAKQLQFLKMLPGIGAVRANALLERFESIESVIKASKTELQTAEGIGDKTAADIRDLVEEELSSYYCLDLTMD